jgi:hypothetical protein
LICKQRKKLGIKEAFRVPAVGFLSPTEHGKCDRDDISVEFVPGNAPLKGSGSLSADPREWTRQTTPRQQVSRDTSKGINLYMPRLIINEPEQDYCYHLEGLIGIT